MISVLMPYSINEWGQLKPLVRTWPFKPLANHNGWRESQVLDLACSRIASTVKNADSAAWVLLRDHNASGFASLTMLPWDSEQLGLAAARIDYLVADGTYSEQAQAKNHLLNQVLAEACQRGIQHLSVRVDASDLSSIHLLEANGFITVDGILTFALPLANHKSTTSDHDFNTRLATVDDAEEAAALARTAYIYDRFHSDPCIDGTHADNLHATWLRNACLGRTGDAVIVAEDKSGLLGFVTCALQHDTAASLGATVGTIVLVASATRARGRGVGFAATLAALDWFKDQGCEMVEVGTQLRNIPASRLYQRCGFRLVGSSMSLRLVL